MATGYVYVDTGSTIPLASNTISEDALTKHINRSVLNSSAGTEIATAANPLVVTLASGLTNTVVMASGATNTVGGAVTCTPASGTTINVVMVGGTTATIGGSVIATPAAGTTSMVMMVAGSTATVGGTVNATCTMAAGTTAVVVQASGTTATVGGSLLITPASGTTSTVALASGGTVTVQSSFASIGTVTTQPTFVKSIKNVCITTYSAAAETTLVPAVAGKRLKVVAFSAIAASTASNTIYFKDDTAGTTSWSVQFVPNGVMGANLATSAPSFLWATNGTNKPLTVAFSAAVTANLSVSYWDDDAS